MHCRHHGTIHQTQTTTQGTMDTMGTTDSMELFTRRYVCHQATWTPSALQTPANNAEYTMDTSRHCIHQETIHWTLYTPQTNMDTMRTAETRQQYNRHNGHHKDPWSMQTTGNLTTDKMHTTTHNGHHGQWIQDGTYQQTLCTPPGTVGTMLATMSV